MKANFATRTFSMGVAFGAIAVASIAFAIARADLSDSSTDSSRLQRLEDRAAIEELLVEYGHDLDHRDFAGYAGLFAAQGTWSGSIGTFTGPTAIQAAMEKSFKRPTAGGTPARTFHLMTNFSIRVDGDRATASSKWTFFRMNNSTPAPTLAGMYDDSFVREGGRWKFLRRVASAAQAP